jgi:hypothetical protein
LQHSVDQPIVEIKTGLRNRTCALWQDTRPGNGKTISRGVQFLDKVKILGPSMIVIASDLTVASIEDLARSFAKNVPDTCATASFLSSTLYLVRGGADAEKEISWEAEGKIFG